MGRVELTDEMQTQARALSDPSRFRLFRHISEATESVDVAELTELLGFNHNAIRQHLAILVDAGLVAESTELRRTRGRPRKLYAPRTDALHAFGGATTTYTRLSSMLLELYTSGDDPYAVGYREGNEAAGGAISDGPDGVIGAVIRQLSMEGFAPTPYREDALTLGTCPFADVAAQNAEVVCTMHRGLIDGYLAGHGGAVECELSPKPPHEAGCGVRLVGRTTDGTTPR